MAKLWFDVDFAQLNADERTFVVALRLFAESWNCNPDSTFGLEPIPKYPFLRVCVDICDELRSMVLMTVGAYLEGRRLTCGRFDGQEYCVDPRFQSASVCIEGDPEELGERAATWFETQLGRPVEYREWRVERRISYDWRCLDNGEVLVVGGDITARGRPHRAPDVRVQVR